LISQKCAASPFDSFSFHFSSLYLTFREEGGGGEFPLRLVCISPGGIFGSIYFIGVLGLVYLRDEALQLHGSTGTF
jgi:hypothetical protein